MTSPQTSAQTTTVSFSTNSLINALLPSNPQKWGGALGTGITLTYSFPWENGQQAYWQTNYSGDEPNATTHLGFNSTQIEAAKNALQEWADVANINFVQVADTASDVGDFRFAFSSEVGTWWGWCSYPNNYWARAADVWINPKYATDTNWSPGTYNFHALMHEIGHGLGLDHSFEGPFTIPSNLEACNYTIMSYTDPANAWYYASGQSSATYTIKTPMVYDILAIQYLYGANTNYHSGNDTYAINPNEAAFQTIWDGGGIDTIDTSSFTTNTSIDLRDGAYSSIPLPGWDATNNFGIAFGAIIENFRCGSGNDIIHGNNANNIIDGGGGVDTAVLGYSFGAGYTVSGTANALHLVGSEGDDFYSNVEYFQFSGDVTKSAAEVLGSGSASSISINDVTITEGNSGTQYATFTVTRSGGTAAFAVNYATATGTATAGNDYGAVNGTLSFAANQSTATISVPIYGDTTYEPNETFYVNLSGSTNGATISDSQGLGIITNDDPLTTVGTITHDIQAILQRAPNTGEAETYASWVNVGGHSLTDVVNSLIASPEAQDDVAPVIRTYQAVYGRVPDAGGLDYWVDVFRALKVTTPDDPRTTTVNEPLVQLLKTFVDPIHTPEFATLYGSNPTGGAYTQSLYINVLHRTPDSGGLAYWTNVYNAVANEQKGADGVLSASEAVAVRAILLEQFVSSTEYKTNVGPAIATFLTDAANGTQDYNGSLWDDVHSQTSTLSAGNVQDGYWLV